MKPVTDAEMLNVKAGIAASLADLFDKGEKVIGVAGTLQVDEPEARRLINRGRRLERAKVAQQRKLTNVEA